METSIKKYGIFWEPPEPLSGFVAGWKDLVAEAEPDAVYLHHPVHSTVYVLQADEQKEDEIIYTLETSCKKISPFHIGFTGWLVFRNDAATGGNTFAVGIERSDELFQCQWKIASDLVTRRAGSLSYPVEWQGPFLESMNRFGFPFVGAHWLPHISIASVKGMGNLVREEAESSSLPVKEALLGSLSVYKISGDRHEHLRTVQLDK